MGVELRCEFAPQKDAEWPESKMPISTGDGGSGPASGDGLGDGWEIYGL